MESLARKRTILIVIFIIIALLAAVGLAVGLTLGLRHDTAPMDGTAPVPTDSPGIYRRGAVATDYGPCSEMARNILIAGGSAVDASITASLCLGVASPQSSGLGGGLFMVIYSKNGSAETITANEAAPAASHFDMFVNNTDEANYGARAVSVPSELAGLWTAHQKYGVLPWRDLVRPVIDMAQDGFPLAWHTEYCLKTLEESFDRWPILRELYTKPNGSLMKTGDIFTPPASLVQTLRAIAEEGMSALHGGEVGRKLVQDIQDQGGVMTMDDLLNYRLSSQPPVVLNISEGQRRVMSTPVTSSGNLLQFTISVMDECNLATVNFSSYEGKLKLYHYFIEASTFAIGLRLHIGDFGKAENDKAVAALSSKEYAQTICSMINDTYVTYQSDRDYDTFNDLPETASPADRVRRAASGQNQAADVEAWDGMFGEDVMDGDTSHLSVYSEQGDAVSLTTSVGRYFGSRTFSNQTGLFLNGHMGNFYYNGRSPSWEANRLSPGAHAMSTICPAIVTDQKGVLGILGSSGGMRIISTNAWVILRSLWGSESLSEIIDSPRVYAYRSSSLNKTYYEKNFPEDLVEGLKAMGHNMELTSSFSAAQGILVGPGPVIQAHSDRRKRGYAAGY
ncbi:gamma-glutamyltranspeptidase 1-like [Acanthaster planci]|uniref:Gamma-glutamyltranspeptidase 1-like n=1 Tax=Acanthaster planci TaxID=133434 RepID=A0A8B7ZRX8_ACAPL|nr:gamma-glutamyltranspeptidase 1-like [Acanthaster planci]XP_022106209.1 gamma-glutamyltranspeptidase 1-like [Acanthaster planci]XP_022106216.1 gamma-glutamyltranspeptidase 1-like [Acanthaster planci]XP_022106227.1 gamma-glutamyltranspeptidase 1-like [Acanthaster planci]XP_022106235.1 gamma-glutamyltranspeptidase 1-like [Acanthaster planci]